MQSFCFEYDEDFIEKGIVQLRTNEFSAVTTKAEIFEYNSKIVKVTFGASRTLSRATVKSYRKMYEDVLNEDPIQKIDMKKYWL